LASRHEAILRNWEAAIAADPEQSTSRSQTRGEFQDLILRVLAAFQRKLNSVPRGRQDDADNAEQSRKS
jgi:hypothetical protein